jgi:hypothetical protein
MSKENNSRLFQLSQRIWWFNTPLVSSISKILKQGFLLLLFAVFTNNTHAVGDTLSYSELYKLSSDSLLSLADEFHQQYETSNDCMALATFESLVALANVKLGSFEDDFTVECGTSWTFFVRGMVAFNRARYKEAEALFLRSRSLVARSDDPILPLLLQNLGASKQVKSDLQAALLYYDSAYSIMPERDGLLLQKQHRLFTQ